MRLGIVASASLHLCAVGLTLMTIYGEITKWDK